ncbi:proline-rich protein HaeIII subfamily 1-like [Oxyura jamaicensis]|uniref:proline-rich protein HaeIII subfamily 1-like n=1 Tax=Oxyura jamaicensis TaxID=8884 RepID=UPI0015A659D2|nr:proline-rich protein HaeIII subfamily 1-like [Oxyura jamaicensis]
MAPGTPRRRPAPLRARSGGGRGEEGWREGRGGEARQAAALSSVHARREASLLPAAEALPHPPPTLHPPPPQPSRWQPSRGYPSPRGSPRGRVAPPLCLFQRGGGAFTTPYPPTAHRPLCLGRTPLGAHPPGAPPQARSRAEAAGHGAELSAEPAAPTRGRGAEPARPQPRGGAGRAAAACRARWEVQGEASGPASVAAAAGTGESSRRAPERRRSPSHPKLGAEEGEGLEGLIWGAGRDPDQKPGVAGQQSQGDPGASVRYLLYNPSQGAASSFPTTRAVCCQREEEGKRSSL